MYLPWFEEKLTRVILFARADRPLYYYAMKFLACFGLTLKMRLIAFCLESFLKYSLCRQLNCTSSSLHKEINFSVSSSEKVVFAFVDGDLLELVATVTTSSAILKQENFTFLPYSVEICIDFGCDCRSVLKHVLKSYDIFCDVHDRRRGVVGLIYTKQLMS